MEGTVIRVPQPGIFALGTASHAYLEFDLLAGVTPGAAIARVAGLREPRTTIGGVNLVSGFRPELWRSFAPDLTPEDARGFDQTIVGPGGTLPATQHDIVLWLTGPAYDVVFDVSRGIAAALDGVASLAHELVGWPYHRDLDLTGFIDGTENPTIVEAAAVAIVPEGEPGEGSSILLLQQWEHDVMTWEALPVSVQEDVIGRRKPNSEELSPRLPTSHVARTDQDRFGKIFRRNIPYGSLADHGTIFVGFSARQSVLAAMLESMVGLGDAPSDRLLGIARAVTGAYYVIPPADCLDAFAGGDADGGRG